MGIPKAYYQFGSSTMVDQTFDQSMNFWGNMQMHMGIIAASVPCLKPLFKKSSNSTSNNNNQYDDIERAQTYGSGRPSKRRRTFLTTNGTLNGNENFELTSRTSVRESVLGNFSTSGQGKKNAVYSVTEERVGSEDNILDDKEDLKGIMRTREVTVQHAEKADQKWPLGQ
ncbi:uncharacterized protein J4E87_001702 [Alternaria ethzedia]|uniref:uncharacterized protein n=1 Tax=Alternaria ethzedia TaxID=181014 RepID=UPI0020C42DAE|nr:uncharacterized protein J4E87_001702 [Alternaria ethzedia]KAI4632230.1 hypothetical protein J4E87_001702 [Alternaria ethzedia]